MFVYMQFFYLPPVMIIFIHFVWQTSHGASVFVYIFVNKSMRKEAFQMIRNILKRKKVTTIQVVAARNVQS
uniref:Uncharacterized protein n=1 Tax=Acrobeloides nanus TaxID=290746 RepID=A0A914EMR5_9BILA